MYISFLSLLIKSLTCASRKIKLFRFKSEWLIIKIKVHQDFRVLIIKCFLTAFTHSQPACLPAVHSSSSTNILLWNIKKFIICQNSEYTESICLWFSFLFLSLWEFCCMLFSPFVYYIQCTNTKRSEKCREKMMNLYLCRCAINDSELWKRKPYLELLFCFQINDE